MPNDIAHFAIHADDCPRAKAFYENVSGWTFGAWGPLNFWRIHTSPGAPEGALQQRREALTGTGTAGFVCTIGVDDVQAIAEAIGHHVGKVTL